MTDISRRLAQFAYDLGYESLPKDVVERTKLLILDTAGIMVRARNDVESTPSMVRAIKALGLDNGECAVPGDTATYAPSAAALLNGTLAHSLLKLFSMSFKLRVGRVERSALIFQQRFRLLASSSLSLIATFPTLYAVARHWL